MNYLDRINKLQNEKEDNLSAARESGRFDDEQMKILEQQSFLERILPEKQAGLPPSFWTEPLDVVTPTPY